MMKLYFMNTDEVREAEAFRMGCSRVDEFRLQKINQCKSIEDKVRSLCCGLLLQYAVREELGSEAERSLRYHIGAYGKPYFRDYPQLHFNLSHSGCYAALAFSSQEVGIDIQKKHVVRERLAGRILSEREYRQYCELKNKTEKLAEEYFFRCWCARESYGKLCGQGIFRILEGSCYETETGRISRNGKAAALCREYLIDAEYMMNVCIYERERSCTERFPEEVTCLKLSHILS